ncbi:diadenosine tetraphosphate (Ap4A) hydrolase [Methylophaga lonarensis MPL]|uniref:Diadenosine tetraphosphate (Ap4A) hydrolase n=2 Tax=Methylophaga lonarensis TaxID=999151 RepID=M7NVF7_9GAMM|nr:diadenosine tetraphosphate (Ap4A) hydrolase [Methylophaga lonarensis MPL]
MFELHPRLTADTFHIADLPLCRLLLMNDSRYPWLILVPRQASLTEVYQLDQDRQHQLWDESALVGERLMQFTNADKLNIAALGNQVPQLHVHHVARFQHDSSWPAPIWGIGTAEPYLPEQSETLIASLRQLFADQSGHGD